MKKVQLMNTEVNDNLEEMEVTFTYEMTESGAELNEILEVWVYVPAANAWITSDTFAVMKAANELIKDYFEYYNLNLSLDEQIALAQENGA